jgi:flagellar hook protein FlgE
MIEGDGFFVVRQGESDDDGLYPNPDDNSYSEFYTRAGNFYFDSVGTLVTTSGMKVQGVMAGEKFDDFSPGDTQNYPLIDADGAEADEVGDIKINTSLFKNIYIDQNGDVRGVLKASDESVVIATLAIATFVNNEGLEKAGNSLYTKTANSGEVGSGGLSSPTTPLTTPTYFQAATNGAGKINQGGLEMSNVDLASEFTDMIVTQRGFQANSRIITVSDTLLEELVNLKR